MKSKLAETTEYKRFEILKSQVSMLLLHPEKNTIAMSKNTIHNFNLSIKNSTAIKSSEHLTEAIIKELAKVSNEMNQQKDITQIWQEQSQNASLNYSNFPTEGGANETIADRSKRTAQSVSNTPSVSGETTENTRNSSILFDNISLAKTSTFSAPIGEGVADTTGRTAVSSFASANITSPILGVESNTLNLNSGLSTQTYANVAAQQSLIVPQKLQANTSEPTIETIKAEIKEKLDLANKAGDAKAIEYWTRISKAFDEGKTAKDFDGQPNEMLFTEMYAVLKQLSQTPVKAQNFNWDVVRKKMVESIDANILKGKISDKSKIRWNLIKKQLNDDKVNIANLFEQYDELFLLLKEVEGLVDLPNTITITTKTKIYPNLSADKVYADIGKEAVYAFLKEVSNKEISGSGVKKNGVKIKSSESLSFIVGESIEFFIDETFLIENQFPKENINWVVYNSKNKKDKGIVFVNEGTLFSYNFDTAGTYKIEAYGLKSGANSKTKAKTSAFVELNIIAQEIVIAPPASVKNGFTRALAEEQLFKVSLKNSEIKTLNPLKLYYHITYTDVNKIVTISDEQELNSTGIFKLVMSNIGEYAIKVYSKDQYGLSQNQTIRVIKNFIESIDVTTKGDSGNDVYLLNETNRNAIFKAGDFRISATQQEKENVKWLVYEENGKTYIPNGSKLQIENNEAGKQFLFKGETFVFPIPKKEGVFIVEAYSNIVQGLKSKSIAKIYVKHPKVTEAFWTYNDGSKKKTSGFTGEVNHVKASIPEYINQPVKINFFLNDSKEVAYFHLTSTNGEGQINKQIVFNAALQKRFGILNGKTAKVRFELEGIQNKEAYLFKKNANAYNDAVLNVTTKAQIIDAYFMYDGSRVKAEDEIPFNKKGTTVTIVAKTQNMVGKDIVLTAHKVGEKPAFRHEVKVNSEGVATISFVIRPAQGLKNGVVNKYYVGIEGYSTKHLTDKMINMVVGVGSKKMIMANLTWGSKVSQEFREKVIEICEDLWPENTIEMANGLMAVMYRETNRTFAANQLAGYKSLISRDQMTQKHFENINKETGKMSSRAVGLIQFTQAALVSMKEFENGTGFDKLHALKLKYAKMTEVEQLEKVRKYFKSVARLPKMPEDIYVAVFSPDFVGKKDTDTLYKKGTNSYKANPGLDKNNDGIQKSELLIKYRDSLKEGNKNVNLASVNVKENEDRIVNSELDKVQLHFEGATAVENSLSIKTKNILKEVGIKSKNFNIYITSTARSTYDQARIMYQNCSQPGGVIKQKGIYDIPGQIVIDVYSRGIKSGDSKKDIIASMESKIKELGASTVSKHIADFKVLNTLDISYGKLSNKNDFLFEINKRKELDKVLIENNCYHVQIKQ